MLDDADVKTLRLAAREINEDDLVQFLDYQRRYLAMLQDEKIAPDVRLAHARMAARASLNKDAHDLAQTEMICAEFCARRTTVRMLRQRVEGLEALPSPSRSDAAALMRAKAEFQRLDDMGPFARRYGDANAALLVKHEEALMGLYAAIRDAEQKA